MVNVLKTIFDHCYCMMSMTYSLKFTKSMGLYFVAISQSTGGLNVFINICVPMKTKPNLIKVLDKQIFSA